MSEAVKNTSEHIEGDYAEVLEARDEAVAILHNRPGIGPPDLCWLRKAQKGPLGGYGDAKGYYHWVVGQDVSSAASIAAYFAELTGGLEQPGMLASLVRFSEWVVEGGVYCCYDAFSRLDLRCELSVPGGVSLHAVDGHGRTVDVDAGLWKGALVSAFMRSRSLDRAALVQAGCVRTFDMLPTPSAEGRLLRCVKDLYQAGVVSASRDMLQQRDVDGGDVLARCVYGHFVGHERLIQGVDFFAELLQWDVDTAVYAAALQERLGLNDAALETLEGSVDVKGGGGGGGVALLVALSNMLLRRGEGKAALQVARRAVRSGSALRGAWLALARAYLTNDAPRLAMVSLNLMPAPPLEADEMASTFVVLPPASAGQTHPLATLHSPDLEEEVKVAEESQQVGREELMLLSAAQLLPLYPPAAPEVYDLSEGCESELPAKVRAEVFSILVEMTNLLGWNGFLEVRASVFIMEEQNGPARGGRPSASSGSGVSEASDEDEFEGEGGGGEEDDAYSDGAFDSGSDGAPTDATDAEQPPSPSSPPPPPRPASPPPPSPAAGGVGVEESSGVDPQHLGGSSSSSAPPARGEGKGGAAGEGQGQGQGEGGGSAAGLDDGMAAEKKRICAMWLDELIQALYEDLSEYMDWRLLEWRARRARKRAGLSPAAGGVFSDDEDSDDDDGECAHAPAPAVEAPPAIPFLRRVQLAAKIAGALRCCWGRLPPRRSSARPPVHAVARWDGEDVDEVPPLSTAQVDWQRRGGLCERLMRAEDAERSYRVCVHEGFNMTSWVSLARLYSSWAWTSEALMAVAQILAHHDYAQDFAMHKRVPLCVRQAVNVLIKRVGLQELRSVQRQLGEPHPAVHQLLFDSVEWHTVGFDR